MAALIDSSVLIAAERGHLDLDDISARYAEEDVALSADRLRAVGLALAR